MISIREEEVPSYLRSSQYFENAFQHGDIQDFAHPGGSIDVPVDCLKRSPVVNNEDDLHIVEHNSFLAHS